MSLPSAWYRTRAYYRASLSVPIVLGICLAIYTLAVDNIKPCNDPFGITKQCLMSASCNVEHCMVMSCDGHDICVPDVQDTCFVGRSVIIPDSCPVNQYPYSVILTSAYITILLIDGLLYITTRLYIRFKAHISYEKYPSLVNIQNQAGETCPHCGTEGVVIGVQCTMCRGNGMHQGTYRPIPCDSCNGTGRIKIINPN